MGATREKALVGLFVLVALAMLFATALALTGGLGVSRVAHHAYFKFSGGIEPGAAVRYGGLSVGKVTKVHVDPQNSTRIEVEFQVDSETPLKTDSVARVTALGFLSDNYLEVSPGSLPAPRAAPGSVINSKEAFSIDDLTDAVATMLPDVKKTLGSLNTDLAGLQTTIDSANDLLSTKNRAAISALLNTLNSTLAELRPQINRTVKSLDDMLADAQPKISATLTDVQAMTKKFDPIVDNLGKTLKDTDKTVVHVDETLEENRKDIKASIATLRETLDKTSALVGQLNSTLSQNSDNLDATLDNVRLATENLRQLTDTLKTSPSSIIRGTGIKDRKPGGKK